MHEGSDRTSRRSRGKSMLGGGAGRANGIPNGGATAAFLRWVILRRLPAVGAAPAALQESRGRRGLLLLPGRRRHTGGRPHQHRPPDPSLPPAGRAPGGLVRVLPAPGRRRRAVRLGRRGTRRLRLQPRRRRRGPAVAVAAPALLLPHRGPTVPGPCAPAPGHPLHRAHAPGRG
ncbi:hypothetical protein PVAP13_8NG061903 [Panicum virgatum]|uniref:Uncharacterized protein n=1 Tax=Panicum virgatum TaxID=38727 RepID=A0A8T0P286_PANVG|nr:hypothetical protein PVAP13_8NG061903 [Panicum virgatum]